MNPGPLPSSPSSRSALQAAWNELHVHTPSLWDMLDIQDLEIVLRPPGSRPVPLSSVSPDRLPPLPEGISPLGRFLTRRSTFANILARRRGKEEVTFYSLLGRAHGRGINHVLDRLCLNLGSAALNWRRTQVVAAVRRGVQQFLEAGAANFALLDVGSGGGFDGLDLIRALRALASKGLPVPEYRIVNVDIDSFWLDNNARLAAELFPEQEQARIQRRNISIFDYLEQQTYASDLKGYDNLIISCNGFADFFEDGPFQKLLEGINAISRTIPGRTSIILPMALKNLRQERLSEMVGFGYIAREKAAIIEMVTRIFPGFSISHEEQYSQLVFLLEKQAGS